MLIALAGAFLSCPGAAQDVQSLLRDGAIGVRAYTEPEEQVWLGQLTRLTVEVRTSIWFTDAPRYPDIQVGGAIALLPGQFGSNSTERVGGVTYAVQRRSYLVFPQRAGRLDLPAIDVQFATQTVDGPSGPLSLQTEPLALEVRFPQEAQDVQHFVTTPQLRIDERYDRAFEELQAGDAIVRTVSVSASDTLALLLPELSFGAPDGISVYPSQPEMNDAINRGVYRGERTESVTYMLEEAGDFTLPEIELHWWNPETEELHRERLDEVSFSVAAGPSVGAVDEIVEEVASPQAANRVVALAAWLKANMVWIGLIGAMVYVLDLALRRVAPLMISRLTARRREIEQSEGFCFRKLERACAAGDDKAIHKALWAWME